ncbi:protein-L-isoaspartate O-methyltransferase [Phellopilus nigrolimitatus]|nr:protein-L-isoaspartate O-methyltransferase [Phellopilus nigrolimitatus]
MAYTCSGSTNEQLIQNMRDAGLIPDDARLAAAFREVDRAHYVSDKRDAYVDAPQAIMCNATISAPHMHAEAAKHLLPFLTPGASVLDVGSGSGYTCALFHHLVSGAGAGSGAAGTVVGIEHMAPLAAHSLANLRADGLGAALDAGRIEVVAGDGRAGHAPRAPYDAIHVGAAAPAVPAALVAQLKAPGRMFVPVGTGTQTIIRVDKDAEGRVTETPLLGVMYVPLTDAETQAGGRRF